MTLPPDVRAQALAAQAQVLAREISALDLPEPAASRIRIALAEFVSSSPQLSVDLRPAPRTASRPIARPLAPISNVVDLASRRRA